MRKQLLWSSLLLVLIACSAVTAQGPFSAQVQAALRAFRTTNQTITGTWTFTTPPVGAGTPGGSDTQVQFNDGGSFGGDSALVWNKTTNTLTLSGLAGIAATTTRTTTYGNLVAAAVELTQASGQGNQYASLGGESYVADTDANGSYSIGVAGLGSISTSENTTAVGMGLLGYATSVGANNFTNTTGGLIGVSAQIVHVGSGTLTSAVGVKVVGGSGANITNQYGLFIEDLTAATNDWAIKTGAGLVEFGDAVLFGAAGVRASAADGVLTLLGLGDGNDENLTFDFDNAAANEVNVGTGTSVAVIDFGTITLEADFNSSDGTAGLTQTCASAVVALTIKDGLITAVTCP